MNQPANKNNSDKESFKKELERALFYQRAEIKKYLIHLHQEQMDSIRKTFHCIEESLEEEIKTLIENYFQNNKSSLRDSSLKSFLLESGYFQRHFFRKTLNLIAFFSSFGREQIKMRFKRSSFFKRDLDSKDILFFLTALIFISLIIVSFEKEFFVLRIMA